MGSPLLGLIEEAPTGPGVYLLLAAEQRLVYVGKAGNLRRRLKEHARADRRTFRSVVDLRWEETPDERTALVREADLIVLIKPRGNRAHTAQNKHCYVRIGDTSIDLVDAPVCGYGTFMHVAKGTFSQASTMTKAGFAALLRLLWVVQADRNKAARIPGRIAGDSPPLTHPFAVADEWREPLHDFLMGTSISLVPALHARVLDADDLPEIMQLSLARDAEAACTFFELAPARLRAARERYGLADGPVDGRQYGRLLAAELGVRR
ncbi:MAG TPA: nucleotide excision repair endonuclease [Acidimicrobiales bacterium]|nr:nucleotide excision repair endonuclease [Acidimicrobiales bacterium]